MMAKMKALVNKLLASVKALYREMKPNSYEGRMVLEMQNSLQKFADLFSTGVKNAAVNREARMSAADSGNADTTSDNRSDSSDVMFELRNIGGEILPVIDTTNDTRKYSEAEAYLKTLVSTEKPFSTILYDAQPVYIGSDLPGEYRSSEYTKSIDRRIREVKMQAATNLDEMILIAENGEWEKNIKDKHNIDAKNGWYRYETTFAVPILNAKKAVDHYNVYGGTLIIRNDADGKSYLYDVVDVEKKKVISSSPSTAKKRSGVFEPKPSQAQYTKGTAESQEFSSQDRTTPATEADLREAEKAVKSEQYLVGQIEQGKRMAKELRKREEKNAERLESMQKKLADSRKDYKASIAEVKANSREKLSNAKAAARVAANEQYLVGQIEQGKKMAKELRKQREASERRISSLQNQLAGTKQMKDAKIQEMRESRKADIRNRKETEIRHKIGRVAEDFRRNI